MVFKIRDNTVLKATYNKEQNQKKLYYCLYSQSKH